VGQSGGGRLLGGNCLTGAAAGVVHKEAALPDLPDLPYRSGRVRHQIVTLDELGRNSGSQWGWGASWGEIAWSELVGVVVDNDAALPDLPDLPYRSGRVRHQTVPLDELGRNSGSEWGWAPPGEKLSFNLVIAGDSTHYALLAKA
jgi:hypothetical protein